MNLSREELEKLSEGREPLGHLGPAALVPFLAYSLLAPRVIWINMRYLAERGLNSEDNDFSRRFNDWLIEEFAYICLRDGNTCGVSRRTRTFHADRYGESAATPHGGSARCATSGTFQIKGIGRTPLLGFETDWHHSHGCMWLEEAIRETIFAEIVNQEFPHGAAETIAIIDTGLQGDVPPYQQGERRVLLIRPAIFRIAHLQRSFGYRTAGDVLRERLQDVQRTTDAIHFCERSWKAKCGEDVMTQLGQIFHRIGEQIIFGYQAGISPGRFFSSNIQLDAALFDFGDASAEESLFNANYLAREYRRLHQVAESLTFYCNKYGTFKLPGGATDYIKDCLMRGGESPHFHRGERLGGISTTSAEKTKPVRQETCEQPEIIARRRVTPNISTFQPRPALSRAEMQMETFKALGGQTSSKEPSPEVINGVISRALTLGRRIWKQIPSHLTVLAQATDGLSAIVVCKDKQGGDKKFWIQTTRIGQEIFFFGSRQNGEWLTNCKSVDNGYVAAFFDVPLHVLSDCCVEFGSACARIPRLHWY